MWIQAQGSPEWKGLTWASHSVLSLDTQVSHKKRKYDTNGRSDAWRCLVAVPEKIKTWFPKWKLKMSKKWFLKWKPKISKTLVPEAEAKMVASAFATWNPKMSKKWFPKWKPQMLKKWFRKWKPKMSRKLEREMAPKNSDPQLHVFPFLGKISKYYTVHQWWLITVAQGLVLLDHTPGLLLVRECSSETEQ